ncbi:MAG: hypothetical protein JNJ61_18650 [Anaerolineae bacterium]|nr:hypothetical protein [Anaerolineae bacterium]
MKAFSLFLLGVFLFGASHAIAQQNNAVAASDLSPETRLILEDVNEYRRTTNVVHLVPNTALNQVAQIYVDDLSSRPPGNLGNIYTSNNQSVDELLNQNGYVAYSDGYVVDFIPLVIRNITPDQLFEFLIQDSQSENRTVLSRRMSLSLVNILPLSSPLYREIGLAYEFNAETQRYIYVLIFAAQPNVLPVVVTVPDTPSVIAENVIDPNVQIRIHNENTHTNGDRVGETIFVGSIEDIRISEQPEVLACPTAADTTSIWRPYRNVVTYELTAGFGLKTLYVQMCDKFGRTLISQTSVTFARASDQLTASVENVTPGPDVIGIANATQTAAASATAYAPVIQTVEAILTATAAP